MSDKEEKRVEREKRQTARIQAWKPVMAFVFDTVEESRALPNGKTPFNDEIKVVKDVVYKEVDGKKLVMDIYFPSQKVAEKSPVVFDVPGGGWMIHNRLRRDGYARLFATLGAVVCLIDHRLAPQVFFPENLKDVIDGLNFLDKIADEYSLDTSNVTITGDSSGGHLAACAACASTSEDYRKKLGLPEMAVKPKKCIFISGAFSFETMYRIPFTHLFMVRYFCGKGSRKAYRKWEFYKESDPYNYISKDFPETFNNGGGLDLLCLGEAKRMAKKLTAAGVKNEVVVGGNILNNGHCYILRIPFSPARRDMLKLMSWYAKVQKELGVDMSKGLARVEKFLMSYADALSGKIKC